MGNCNWSIPADVIDQEISTEIIDIAKVLINDKQISLEEIELWIKYMKLVWNISKEKMEEALLNWTEELAASDINNYEGMEYFVRGEGLKMFIDENDIKNIKFQTIIQVAKQMNISFTTIDEAYKKIKRVNKNLYNKMEVFIKAYEDWFKFHKNIEELGRQGNLNKTEQNELNKLIEARDGTRKELINEINGLQA